MKRIVEFELVGKKYPLNFSVKVARKADEEFGGIENLGNIMDNGISKGLDAICSLIYEMMQQGAAYRKLTEGVEIELPTKDELEVLISVQDLEEVQKALVQAAGIGSQPTVEVEAEEKNAEATQSE